MKPLLLLLFMNSGVAVAQKPDKTSFINTLHPALGLHYQGQFFGDLNLMRVTWHPEDEHHYFRAGPRVGIEANFRKDRFVYAPKLGVEVSGMFFMLRASVLTYIEGGKADTRFLPEAGLSYMQVLHLSYGYAAPLSRVRNDQIRANRISLTINLDRNYTWVVTDLFGNRHKQ